MLEIRKTSHFSKWFARLSDVRAKAKIAVRIDRLAMGHAGDVSSVGAGVSEMRVDYGPGYRVYFCRRDASVIILLCAGNKSSQRRDIRLAMWLAGNLEV